jgi:endonuclease YncB( thermonuclease family)
MGKNSTIGGCCGFLSFLFLLTFLFITGFYSSKLYADSIECTPQIASGIDGGWVRKVVDGDTVHVWPNRLAVKNDQFISVRLLGIDTPETHYQGQDQGEVAYRATDHLKSLLRQGDPVKIVFDQEPCDFYRRFLGYIEYEGHDINAYQVMSGYAVNYCIYPNIARCEKYARLMGDSLDSRRSFLIRYPRAEVPYVWRMRIRNSAPNKFVTKVNSFKVYDPEFFERIKLALRLFFIDAQDVECPYFLAKRDGSCWNRDSQEQQNTGFTSDLFNSFF